MPRHAEKDHDIVPASGEVAALEAFECRLVDQLGEYVRRRNVESMDHSRFLGSIKTAVGSSRRAANQVERQLVVAQ